MVQTEKVARCKIGDYMSRFDTRGHDDEKSKGEVCKGLEAIMGAMSIPVKEKCQCDILKRDQFENDGLPVNVGLFDERQGKIIVASPKRKI